VGGSRKKEKKKTQHASSSFFLAAAEGATRGVKSPTGVEKIREPGGEEKDVTKKRANRPHGAGGSKSSREREIPVEEVGGQKKRKGGIRNPRKRGSQLCRKTK